MLVHWQPLKHQIVPQVGEPVSAAPPSAPASTPSQKQ
jgi:hypothetical protein